MGMLKRGEVDLDELTAGLIAVHGATRVEGAMTPVEFVNYMKSIGLPLEMSDELRREFKAVESMELLKRMLAGYADHPAPEHCECGFKLISSLVYPFKGEIYESGYCVPCDVHVPEPKGSWSKWNPKKGDYYPQEADDLKAARERQASGRWG